MLFLHWKNEYSVGNEEIDSHHRKLFSLFHKLYDVSLSGCENKVYAEVIRDLVSYAEYHFMAEESYMEKAGYNGLEAHIKEHDYFSNEVANFEKNRPHVSSQDCLQLIDFLARWLVHHIITEDRKIVSAS